MCSSDLGRQKTCESERSVHAFDGQLSGVRTAFHGKRHRRIPVSEPDATPWLGNDLLDTRNLLVTGAETLLNPDPRREIGLPVDGHPDTSASPPAVSAPSPWPPVNVRAATVPTLIVISSRFPESSIAP